MTPLLHLINMVRAHGVEGTAFPFFHIVKPWHGRQVHLAGVWFSREAAEQHLATKRHRYGPKAIVWCASGHASAHWRDLFKAQP